MHHILEHKQQELEQPTQATDHNENPMKII